MGGGGTCETPQRMPRQTQVFVYMQQKFRGKKLFWGILRNRNGCITFAAGEQFDHSDFLSNWLNDDDVYLWNYTTVPPTTPAGANFPILHCLFT